jgi:(p)ppGpp synthase/HD superfamily hydrolase
MLYAPVVERAMRLAASSHEAQRRKGTDVPYVTHLAHVALILSRSGFDDDDILAAALLHDAVEDTELTHDDIVQRFGTTIAKLVSAVSEVKHDEDGVALPWRHRKEEHVARLRHEPIAARAITLADKIHNVGTLLDDVNADPAAWSRFSSTPSEQLWYHRAVLDAIGDEPELVCLKQEYRTLLNRLGALATSSA